jgi:hypothetical protein
MATVLLTTDGVTATQNFQITVAPPPPTGEAIDQRLRLIFTGSNPTPITLGLTGPSADAFSAQLITLNIGHNVITTPVAGIGVKSSDGPNGTLKPNENYHFNIYFVPPPTSTTPDLLTATLTVNGADGTLLASVDLWGSSAQITATIANPVVQYNEVENFNTPVLDVNIVYLSGDTATLNLVVEGVDLPNGLTIPTVNAQLPVQLITVADPANPKITLKIPSPRRTKTIHVALDGIPPGPSTFPNGKLPIGHAYIQVHAPDYPQLEPGKDKFTYEWVL